MHRLTGGIAAALFLMLPVRLAAQDAQPVKIKVTGYAQFQFNTTSVDEEEAREDQIPWSTFETRRIRPTVQVTIADWIEGIIQPDFALGELALKDVYMNFAFDDRFQLRVGQFKKPFSLLELTSSSKILPIERNVRIRGLQSAFRAALEDLDSARFLLPVFNGDLILGEEATILDDLGYLGRDLGLAFHGGLGRFGYEVGLFNGAGADSRDDNDDKSFAGRLTYRLLERSPLTIGFGVSNRELRFEDDPNDILEEEDDLEGTAFEIDAEWGEFRRPGLHILAEAATGENLAVDEPFLGAQGWFAYFLKRDGRRLEGVEPLVRLSFGDPDTSHGDDSGWLLTPGLNLYFFSRNRVMFNYDIFFSQFARFDTEHAFRAQAQLYY